MPARRPFGRTCSSPAVRLPIRRGAEQPTEGGPVRTGLPFDDLLAAAQAGAAWAFETLYRDLSPVVTGYLRLHGAAEPDDLASETFLGVFTGLAGFRGDEEALRAWVFTIAHRRLGGAWRARPPSPSPGRGRRPGPGRVRGGRRRGRRVHPPRRAERPPRLRAAARRSARRG